MTVCLAGINHSNPRPYIIAACDRKISFGGFVSADGEAIKISGINKDWSVMFAGPVSPMTAMIEVIAERMKKLRPASFIEFSKLCREVYLKERRPLLESEVLGDYDLQTYDEYMELKKSDRDFFEEVKKKVHEKESEWELLFTGFDKSGRAHLFTLGECGKICYCDKQGFAAIGSGSWLAFSSLSGYGFKGNLPLSEAIFGIVAAKFSAESAEGVGEETILTIMQSKSENAPIFDPLKVKNLREMWKQLPRFPGERATAHIWSQLEAFKLVGLWGLNRPTRRSVSQTSESKP